MDDNYENSNHLNGDVCIDFYLQLFEYVFLNPHRLYSLFFYISPPEGVSISSPDASGDLGDEGIFGG